jgi:glucose-1-phosphate adenylyltransferase
MVDAENAESTHDFGCDIIPSMLRGNNVYGYRYADEHHDKPYWRDVGTIEDYYAANMDLVSANPPFNLYDRRWPIRTRPRPDPPAKTVHADFDHNRAGVALNSLMADGSILSGARVERSIIGPRVRIHSGAHVTESIMFSDVEIGEGARVHRAIVDKMVRVPRDYVLGEDHDLDRGRFFVSESGISVVTKGTEL